LKAVSPAFYCGFAIKLWQVECNIIFSSRTFFWKKEVVDPKTSICPLEDDGDCTIRPLVDASLSSSIVYQLNKYIRTKGTDGHT